MGIFRVDEGLAIMAGEFGFSFNEEDDVSKRPKTVGEQAAKKNEGLSNLLAQQPPLQGGAHGTEICSVCQEVS